MAGQGEAVEEALQVALRTLEERASMLRRMTSQMRERNRRLARSFEQRAEESQKQADLLREVLEGR